MVAPRFERVAFDTIVGKNKRKARSSRLTCGEQANYPPGAPSFNKNEKVFDCIFFAIFDRMQQRVYQTGNDGAW